MDKSPGGSPQSSPIKSSCPSSPPQSIVSSPIRSEVSSPLTSVASSPFQEGSSVPSSPFVASPSPFQSPQSCDFQQQAKRQKLDNENNQENVPCRRLFTTESLAGPADTRKLHCLSEESGSGDLNQTASINQDSSGGTKCDEEVDVTDNVSVVHDDVSRELDRNSSSNSSSPASTTCSSSSSSSEESGESSANSSEEEDSEESDGERSSQSDKSDTEHNSSSDESDGEFFSPKVWEGCELTEDEAVLLVMDLFTKFKLSKKQIGGILKCILKFLPTYSNFPRTQYTLFQYVEKLSPVSNETTHFYCSECFFYLGTQEMNCSLCKCESHKFFQIPLCDQIRNLFENHGLADHIDKYNIARSNLNLGDGYRDLQDGSEFIKAHVDGQYNLDLMGHTDGISVSDSSFVSLWPLEWVIAQLPPHLRFKYVLINGIWLDESKPYMNTMMKPFVSELKALNESGVTWVHPRTRIVHTTFVSVPCFCADAPARAQIQNILSHGGKHSCHSCELKMKKLPPQPVVPGKKKKPRRRVYTFEGTATLRTAQRMQDQGAESRRRQHESGRKLNPVKGVKGPSEVSKFPGCDISTVVFPEYMHLITCLLKEFMTLWFLKDGPWSLKEHRDKINEFLKSINVPDFITRIPRSTEHFSKWKANEFRSFLLFFSLIILSKCMKREYFQHWMLFVHAIYLLLQDCVSEKCVAKADLLLSLFCRSFAVLYKHDFYTYYVHQLRHLALTVRRHGPLHCNSAFMFESFNGTLAKYIHGTKNQGKELVNNIKIAFGVEVLRARKQLCAAAKTQLPVEFRNQIKHFNVSGADLELLHSCNIVKEPLKLYYRALIKHETFTCSLYKRQKKRNNFTICFLSSLSGNRIYGEIKYFCQSADNKQVALVETFDVDHLNTFCHDSGVVIKHIIPIVPTGITEVVELSAIIFKVIRVENYVCLRPNIYEYNL